MIVNQPVGVAIRTCPATETKQLVISGASQAVEKSHLLGRLGTVVLEKVEVIVIHGHARWCACGTGAAQSGHDCTNYEFLDHLYTRSWSLFTGWH